VTGKIKKTAGSRNEKEKKPFKKDIRAFSGAG
jgi:hypothetical protein